jgi:hypothetical protein
MNEDRKPVTREELQQTLDQALERYVTKNEFAGFVQLFIQEQARSAQALSAMEQRLIVGIRGDMAALEERLMVEIGRAARVAAEENRLELALLDDRYRDLPGRVAALERGLREHAADAAAHGRPRRPTRRR